MAMINDEHEHEVIQSRKLSSDESYLVMKVMIVKEVMTCEVLPGAMFSFVKMSGCSNSI